MSVVKVLMGDGMTGMCLCSETVRCEGPRGEGSIGKGREEDDLLKNRGHEAVWIWVKGRAVVAF